MTELARHLRNATDRLLALGDTDDPEVFEHLIDQTSLWLAWETLHADPNRPMFHRHNDHVSQWGGPNNDNIYIHARIDPNRRYVVRGKMHSCDQFILAVRAGFMHQAQWGTVAQMSASDLGVGPGDEFEMHFGGTDETKHPDAIEMPPTAVMISVRQYYYEWKPEEPAVFTIECLDPEPAEPIDVATLGSRLDASVSQIEDSISYWHDYLANNRADRVDNTFDQRTVAVDDEAGKGLSNARYEFCFWDLEPDQALIVDFDEPAADYWSAHLYNMKMFEPTDPYGAITSRNHRQAKVVDGKVRVVVSAIDPGEANWLDTTGRRNGLCTVRWFWPTSEARPGFTTQVVPVAEVELVTPVSPEERAAELAARQAHWRWRFRS